jgi:predicted nuclease of predicted toxin-antitoxin system
MTILCDVHISYKICKFLDDKNINTIHVNQILNKSETKDSEICSYADRNDYIVLNKDIDFKNTFLINKTPKKLIKINLGNISNQKLMKILEEHLNLIIKLNNQSSFLLEIDTDQIYFIDSSQT